VVEKSALRFTLGDCRLLDAAEGSMSEAAGSITRLVPQLRNRDELAIEEIWRRYVRRIQCAARPVIAGVSPGAGDEEDVAQSAFYSFCEATAAGRLAEIANRDELWRLLLTFTRRKALNRVRHEFCKRRGGGATAVNHPDAVSRTCDRADPPIQLMELQEAFDHLLEKLTATGDPRLAVVARLRLEGRNNQEIADELDCKARTIQRKLRILEQLWTEEQ
jgi:DNA-directed RNA polymerase specialized sigma24 family protein